MGASQNRKLYIMREYQKQLWAGKCQECRDSLALLGLSGKCSGKCGRDIPCGHGHTPLYSCRKCNWHKCETCAKAEVHEVIVRCKVVELPPAEVPAVPPGVN